jgi:hypothetical protein
MGSEDADVYIMQAGEDGEWVNPTSARSLIQEALEDDGDVDPDDVEDIGEYVDWDELRDVFDGDAEDVSFTVEGTEVTIDQDGDIAVE